MVYQESGAYLDPPADQRWRHVTYELRDGFAPCDRTWEREWRFRRETLSFDQTCAKIVVPDQSWVRQPKTEHDHEQDYLVQQYGLLDDDGLDEVFGEMFRERFQWIVWPSK